MGKKCSRKGQKKINNSFLFIVQLSDRQGKMQQKKAKNKISFDYIVQ